MSDAKDDDPVYTSNSSGATWTITSGGATGANGPVGSSGQQGGTIVPGYGTITFAATNGVALAAAVRLSNIRYILKQLDGSFWELIEPQRVKVKDIINLTKLMSVITYIGIQTMNKVTTQVVDWNKLIENLELEDYMVKIDDKSVLSDTTSCIFMLHQP